MFCSIYFLRKSSFYEDLEEISKAETSRYALLVIGEEDFNNSPYRNEDLKMILHRLMKNPSCVLSEIYT